jgi:hypothetical protein
MIKSRNLSPELNALISGMMIGDIFFVNGDTGNDAANGADFDHALKTLGAAIKRPVAGHHDYILGFGAETLTGSIAISQDDVHIIGIGNGGANNTFGRGWQITRAVTVDGIQPAATADRLEIAGICFLEPATDAILIDDAGAVNCFFHHNTVYGSTTASDAIRLDLEGARWVVSDNAFFLCKLAIDVAGAECVIERNYIQDVDEAAKGIVIGATAHRCIVKDNIINLSGGTGDVGITLASSADNCLVMGNAFDDGVSDAINDSGTATMLAGNITAAIAGADGASIIQAIDD